MPPRPETRRALLEEVTRALQAGDVPEARRNAEWMLEDALGCSRAHLFAGADRPVMPEQARTAARMVARRLRREPLQYILGAVDFYGLRLRVTPAVLIPRPETEEVVEHALGLLTGRVAPRVLDVGTGSGCIALALQHARPDAVVAACDVDAAALDVARANAAAHVLAVTFLQADALAPAFASRVPGGLDLLISNPPYLADDEAPTLAPEVRDYEPPRALFAGADPLRFYRALVGPARALLRPGGFLVFETHHDHAEAVYELLRRHGFTNVQLQRDLAGLRRIVSGRTYAGA